VAPRPVNRDTD
jgi:hypothetical protein